MKNKTHKQKLPVMVYIHGGFLSFGSSGSGRPRADQADQVNWMKAKPSGRLASGELRESMN